MSDKLTNTNVPILGKLYSVRCPESEVQALQAAAQYVNKRMEEVQESGKAINLERIAIITALNIAFEYLQSDQQQSGLVQKVNQRISQIQEKLEAALSQSLQTELGYSVK